MNSKLILLSFLTILLSVPGIANSQIVEEEPIYYNGYPGEPILQGVTMDIVNNYRSDGSYANQHLVSASDLEKLSKKFPNLKKYTFVTRIDRKMTSHGNMYVDCETAEWHQTYGGLTSSRWRTSDADRLGSWNTERQRGTGIFEPGANTASWTHPLYVITKR